MNKNHQDVLLAALSCSYRTPFMKDFTEGVITNDFQKIDKHIKAGLDVNELYQMPFLLSEDSGNMTLLQIVTYLSGDRLGLGFKDDGRFSKAIKHLVSCGANVDGVDDFKNTALALTVLGNDIEMLTLLGGQGASPNIQDDEGMNCFHRLMSGPSSPKHTKMLRTLLSLKGARDGLSARDDNGFTPLYYARNEVEAKMLLKHGAELGVVTEDEVRMTPAAYMRERGLPELADKLCEWESERQVKVLHQVINQSVSKSHQRARL